MALKALSFEGLTYYHNKIKTLLSGKVDKEDGKGLSSNDYTTAEKTKLAGIETGADANVIETVQVNGSALSVTDKKVNVDLSAYALKSDISAVYRFKGNVATYADLPNTNQTVGDVYNVEEDGGNYAWTGEGWDDLAGVVDLTEYYTKEEADGKFVDVTGDTMTGALNIAHGSYTPAVILNITDATIDQETFKTLGSIKAKASGVDAGAFNVFRSSPKGHWAGMASIQAFNKSGTSASIDLIVRDDGVAYAEAPTPSNNAENSKQIATTAWVNLASSVVHTTGNETIDGAKMFTSNLNVTASGEKGTIIKRTDKALGDGWHRARWDRTYDMNDFLLADGLVTVEGTKVTYSIGAFNQMEDGTSVTGRLTVGALADGTKYATAPATRETGYGSNDIATCGWVETKIATGGGEAITNDEIDSIFA